MGRNYNIDAYFIICRVGAERSEAPASYFKTDISIKCALKSIPRPIPYLAPDEIGGFQPSRLISGFNGWQNFVQTFFANFCAGWWVGGLLNKMRKCGIFLQKRPKSSGRHAIWVEVRHIGRVCLKMSGYSV